MSYFSPFKCLYIIYFGNSPWMKYYNYYYTKNIALCDILFKKHTFTQFITAPFFLKIVACSLYSFSWSFASHKNWGGKRSGGWLFEFQFRKVLIRLENISSQFIHHAVAFCCNSDLVNLGDVILSYIL